MTSWLFLFVCLPLSQTLSQHYDNRPASPMNDHDILRDNPSLLENLALSKNQPRGAEESYGAAAAQWVSLQNPKLPKWTPERALSYLLEVLQHAHRSMPAGSNPRSSYERLRSADKPWRRSQASSATRAGSARTSAEKALSKATGLQRRGERLVELLDPSRRAGQASGQEVNPSDQSIGQSARRPLQAGSLLRPEFMDRVRQLEFLLPSCDQPVTGVPCLSGDFFHLVQSCLRLDMAKNGRSSSVDTRRRRQVRDMGRVEDAGRFPARRGKEQPKKLLASNDPYLWRLKFKWHPGTVHRAEDDLMSRLSASRDDLTAVCPQLDAVVEKVLQQTRNQIIAEPKQ